MGSPVVHFEIGCRNKSKTAKFYQDLFGWSMFDTPTAAMIDTAPGNAPTTPGQPPKVGINGHINSLGHEPHNYVTIYAQVDDLKASLDKAGKLGGKTLVPPTDVPGMGKFACPPTP